MQSSAPHARPRFTARLDVAAFLPPAYNSRMAETRRKPTAADWTKGFVAALVVYTLLLGPVDGLQSAGRLPEPLATTARWLYAPLAWFIAYAPEPIHKAFFWYVRFWVELFKG